MTSAKVVEELKWMLTGKIAVVTGASRGIGNRNRKDSMAAKGATVVIVNYNGSAAKAEETL